MTEPVLLPATHVPAIKSVLTEQAERQMIEPAQRAGYELELLGATILPQQQVITRTRWGAWLVVDHRDDPTARQYGGKIPIPAAEHAKLVALDEAGVRPDVVWLAHELPATWQEGDRLDQLVPAAAHLREKDARLVRRLDTATKVALKVAGTTLTVAGAAAVAPLGLLGSVGLDPIVLGGVTHPELPVAHWAVLAHWRWQ